MNPLQCDGEVHQWSGLVFSEDGLVRGGKAASVSFAFACGVLECSVGYPEQTVQLSGGRKR